MYQNIKVDIIYYKTATDFEMEFNLSGCCRMRLLTDKAPDRKTLVNQLVRAVSRSRIIMVTGALFGDEGIISTCSKAIGRSLQKIDNKQYGIIGDDSIDIIEDSIPLVSSGGIFGGCIIEQGPQTLMLLSENKNVRKNIMQGLIHSYIKEIYADELTEKQQDEPLTSVPQEPEVLPEEPSVVDIQPVMAEAPVEEIITPEAMDKTTSLTEDENEILDNADVQATPAENNLGIPSKEQDDNIIGSPSSNDEKRYDDEPYSEILFTEDPTEKKDLNDTLENSILFDKTTANREIFNDFEQHFYDPHSDLDDKKPKKKGNGLNIPIVIISIILLVVIAILCYSLFLSPDVRDASIGEYLNETFKTLFG